MARLTSRQRPGLMFVKTPAIPHTPQLEAAIRATLSWHHVTSDQLLALLNTDDSVRTRKLSKPRLLQILRGMVADGEVEKTTEALVRGTRIRYRLSPPARYYLEPDNSGLVPGGGMQLVRRGGTHVVIGKGMTEAEAHVCVTALNEHDRKVRDELRQAQADDEDARIAAENKVSAAEHEAQRGKEVK